MPILISSSSLFAFGFRASRRHHHTYIHTTTNWNRVCRADMRDEEEETSKINYSDIGDARAEQRGRNWLLIPTKSNKTSCSTVREYDVFLVRYLSENGRAIEHRAHSSVNWNKWQRECWTLCVCLFLEMKSSKDVCKGCLSCPMSHQIDHHLTCNIRVPLTSFWKCKWAGRIICNMCLCVCVYKPT